MLATMGFGDVVRIIPGGKLVVSVVILASVAVILVHAVTLLVVILALQNKQKLEK